MSASSRQEPRVMKWETNGELAKRDLSEARGAFTGQITDYDDLATKARAATDATGISAQNEAFISGKELPV